MAELTAAILIASGLATRYGPGTMDQVVENRIRWGQLEPGFYAGYVALMDAEHIGQTVYLEMPDGRIMGPLMVADCAQEEHKADLIERGWAVDLSYELGQELGVTTRPVSGVRVWGSWSGLREQRRH